ncbi:YbhB/YbcL family Raf kinase inhibitor-like protein [Corynebacterium sp. CCM 9185]|uniref:YbhB/YbcL family Raf kinase inhibitor-like protein n=1 Tax=Corynebacterium marambiense TaxID=2765364 RepID=A0ABS0VUN1_9CORY|nr:YbhB/YbcL family Raf kinase inhibitor-like protein [Corynebacterium marambiense]MBI9000465.1 YbhB/YbcL family Raf kinase inhibitor-like protein [Corynebacterium marambiense]MCK7664219.1 YbhB/YbcL family Raf kinase inhibitor-like protein [Corynebacterium marambiense]MCX7543473.1 YbhB/YbcL family Raf kinase inhibitor-like protein [Corynebacterium marambiense]
MTSYADDARFPGPDPYAPLKNLPSFALRSDDLENGGTFAERHLGGNDVSPHLAWSGLPEGTKSIAVTCFDPDAPTGAGFWHWAVLNIPASVSELATGAGGATVEGVPEALSLVGDSGTRGYFGPQPPEGHGPHRYLFAVHAVDVEKLDVPEDASPAILGFNLYFHSIGRAILWGWHENA